jgi:hypothetical protein
LAPHPSGGRRSGSGTPAARGGWWTSYAISRAAFDDALELTGRRLELLTSPQ